MSGPYSRWHIQACTLVGMAGTPVIVSFRTDPDVVTELDDRAAAGGPDVTRSAVVDAAVRIGLGILQIQDQQGSVADPFDVTSVLNRIASAVATMPVVERRSGADRRKSRTAQVMAICDCCCASIRPALGDGHALRPHPEGDVDVVCERCVTCPPGHRHPASEPPTTKD